jgi:adhesin/invasin
MPSRQSGRRSFLGILGLSLVTVAACEKVPLLAPTGSTITLTAAVNALPVGGSTDIIAQVIEASGTPPHSGTRITFLTTLGTIEPSEVSTDVNGRATVKFKAGNANGTATITASSGGATTGSEGAIRIAVGTAAVGNVIVTASPATVPAAGGQTTITARVLDVNGNPLGSTPVVFSADAGTLSLSFATTDGNGLATTILTTAQETTVTASVGAQAPSSGGDGGNGNGGGTGSSGQAVGSVVVRIAAAPSLIITLPSTPPSAGVPAAFTFTVTPAQNGTAIRDVAVNWGDGQRQNLGAISGAQIVTHVYAAAGTYAISATVSDAAGNSNLVSTSVNVIPVPRPTIIVTPSPQTQTVNGTITFNIQVTTAPGIGVQSTSINFGDGEIRQLGGATSASVQKVYTTTGTKTVTVTVLDTTNLVTEGTTSVSITP